MKSKTCIKCGKEKPATSEYFVAAKNYKGGLRNECKVCVAEYQSVYRAANKEHISELKRSRYEVNRQEVLERHRVYWASNKEKIAQQRREFRATNKALIRKRLQAWHKANPNWRRAAENRRRARKLNAGGNYTESDVKKQLSAQKGRCYYCKCDLDTSYQVDHAVPLSRGGSNGPENIVIACRSCNQAKGAKLPHEWVQGGRLL